MRISRLILRSAVCLFCGVTPLFAQSTGERVDELPLSTRPLAWCDLSGRAIATVFLLPEGTLVPLEFATHVSTRTAKRNDRVKFQVTSDVKADGFTVISKGTEAWGIVTLAKKPSHFLRDGKLQIELQSVTLLNRQAIALRSPAVYKQCGKWDWRSTDSLQAPLLALFAPFMLATMPKEDSLAVLGSMISKGDQDERLPGTRIEAVVSRAVELNTEEFSKLQSGILGLTP